MDSPTICIRSSTPLECLLAITTPPKNSMRKKILLTGLKIAISCAVLYLLFRSIHLSAVRPYLDTINPYTYLLANLILLSSTLIAAVRWYLLMQLTPVTLPLTFYMKSYLQGILFNQLLPTSVGGDAYRMMETAKQGQDKRVAINGVLTDRLYGFSGLMIINLLVLGSAYHRYPQQIFWGVTLTVVAALAGILVLTQFYRLKHPFIRERLRWIFDLSNTLKQSYTDTQTLGLRLLLGIIPNLLSICAIACIAKSLHVHTHFADFFIIMPSVVLLTMIPISMAGWGVREGAMVFLGAAIGLPKPALLAISLLYGLSLIINSLPGLYYYLRKQFITQPVLAP